MDREMHGGISKAQGFFYVSTETKELLVCTDASKDGLGRVLMQDGRVIAYISRK